MIFGQCALPPRYIRAVLIDILPEIWLLPSWGGQSAQKKKRYTLVVFVQNPFRNPPTSTRRVPSPNSILGRTCTNIRFLSSFHCHTSDYPRFSNHPINGNCPTVSNRNFPAIGTAPTSTQTSPLDENCSSHWSQKWYQ